MAGGEDEPQEVVADVVVEGGVDVRLGRPLLDLDLTPELLVFALEGPAAAQPVDRPMLGGAHQPRARVVRDA